MDKPILYKEDLQQRKSKGRKGILKHFILRHDLDSLVSEYARALGWSQARVLERMLEVGVARFEIENGLRLLEKRIEVVSKMSNEDKNKEIERQLEQKRRESAKKSKEIEDAYSKSIAHGNSEDWQSV